MDIASNNTIIFNLRQEIFELEEKNSKLQKSVASQERKVSKCKELYKSIDYAINNFFNLDIPYSNCKLSTKDFDDLELISPSVTLKLHCMDVKSLRKAYKENEKQISKLLDQYSSRYTTKANKSIYNLMVIALRAEIQNILYNLKYEKLEKSIDDVKTISAKYLKIAGEGNQSIAGTLTKFIGEIEYLFINAVKIEYNYYVKKNRLVRNSLLYVNKCAKKLKNEKLWKMNVKKLLKKKKNIIMKFQNPRNYCSNH